MTHTVSMLLSLPPICGSRLELSAISVTISLFYHHGLKASKTKSSTTLFCKLFWPWHCATAIENNTNHK